jgi:CRISPR-associated endoribonuclease Cas6
MRFTMLDPALYANFQAAFLNPWSEATIRLQNLPFAVREVVTTPRPDGWTGFTSFQQLLEDAQPETTLTFRFYSPTALSRGDTGRGKQFDLLPNAWGVFDSLCRKWNQFAEEPIANPLLLREWVEQHVFISEVRDLNTGLLRFDRFVQKGFTGMVSYTLQSENEGMLRFLNALADFALYAGVGYKTTWGMGQCRRVKDDGVAR